MGKGRYLIKRLIYIVFVFFIISILMFFIYKATPGDPVRMMIGDTGNIEPERYQQAAAGTVHKMDHQYAHR